MTIQRPANSPVTLTFRSPQGGALIDTPLTVEGSVFTSGDYSEQVSNPATNGAGEFTFYGQPGTVVTVTPDSPIGEAHEPIQFVGVVERPGGLAAVHTDSGDLHQRSPVSELVSDASLVGASIDGSLANVRVHDAQPVPPGGIPDVATPDGTTSTDPDATMPPNDNPDQVTPQHEPASE